MSFLNGIPLAAYRSWESKKLFLINGGHDERTNRRSESW